MNHETQFPAEWLAIAHEAFTHAEETESMVAAQTPAARNPGYAHARQHAYSPACDCNSCEDTFYADTQPPDTQTRTCTICGLTSDRGSWVEYPIPAVCYCYECSKTYPRIERDGTRVWTDATQTPEYPSDAILATYHDAMKTYYAILDGDMKGDVVDALTFADSIFAEYDRALQAEFETTVEPTPMSFYRVHN